MTAFLTGSRVYGTPTKTSDYDLVILLSEEDAAELRIFTIGQYQTGSDFRIKVGQIDLLVFVDEDKFNAWREATAFLKQRKPCTRERAIEVIDIFKDVRGVDTGKTEAPPSIAVEYARRPY